MQLRKPVTLAIRSESFPTRCEVCHQSDAFHPATNLCDRCQGLDLERLQVRLSTATKQPGPASSFSLPLIILTVVLTFCRGFRLIWWDNSFIFWAVLGTFSCCTFWAMLDVIQKCRSRSEGDSIDLILRLLVAAGCVLGLTAFIPFLWSA